MIRLVHVSTIAESLRAFRDQMEFMQTQGIDVHAVATAGAYADELERSTRIHVHRVTIKRPIRPLHDVKSLHQLVRTLRKIKPDIVHAHTPKGGLLGMWAAKMARVPVCIYHLRGLRYVTAQSWQRKLLKACERSACRQADQVLCVSRSLRDMAIDDGIVAEEAIRVLGNGGHGLDAASRFNLGKLPPGTRQAVRRQWNIPEDACVIGFIGRMVVDKGICELWEAWRTLRERYPQAHLLLVGPQESEYPLPEEMMDALRQDHRLHWTGPDFNTPPLYAAMDIACLPSYREGLPKMPLEAAAMELPVVVTDVPGCVDSIVSGETGTLVPVADSSALVHALGAYISDADLRRRHGQAGRAWVTRAFRPEQMQQAMLQEYRRLLTQAQLAHGAESSRVTEDRRPMRKAA